MAVLFVLDGILSLRGCPAEYPWKVQFLGAVLELDSMVVSAVTASGEQRLWRTSGWPLGCVGINCRIRRMIFESNQRILAPADMSLTRQQILFLLGEARPMKRRMHRKKRICLGRQFTSAQFESFL